MTKWFALLTLLTATPFWDNIDVKEWSEEQLLDFFGNSPWSQPAESTAGNGVLTFLATSKPIQLAEVETLVGYLDMASYRETFRETFRWATNWKVLAENFIDRKSVV